MTESAPDGVLDLLGLLAYAELIAFFRLSDDAALAPSLADKAALGEMAVAEFGHFRLLCGQISLMGAQPDQAMLPFVDALDAFHARTAPADWLEGLVKAYVGDGIAADFYRAVAELVDPRTRALVLDVLADTGAPAGRATPAGQATPAGRATPADQATPADRPPASWARLAGCSRGSPIRMGSECQPSAWPTGMPRRAAAETARRQLRPPGGS